MTPRDVEAKWAEAATCPLAVRHPYVTGAQWMVKPRLGSPLLLFVNENPGQSEEKGLVGPSGQFLRDEYLTPADVRFAYLTYSCAHHPGFSRAPEPEELEACAPRLAELVESMRPLLKGIVAVGRVGEETLLKSEWAKDFPCISVVHPSLILRKGWPNPTSKKMVQAQVTKLVRFLAQVGTPPSEALESPREHVCEFIEAGAWASSSTGAVAPLMACLCGKAEPPPRTRAVRSRRVADPAPADDYGGEPDQELEAEDYSNEPEQLTFEVTIRRKPA